MIQPRSFLNVVDYSGIVKVKCIKLIGGMRKKNASIGDHILVSVQKKSKQKMKADKNIIGKGQIFKALVVRTVKNFYRPNGVFISFDQNAVILIDNKNNFLGTRIDGPVLKEFRYFKSAKLFGMAFKII